MSRVCCKCHRAFFHAREARSSARVRSVRPEPNYKVAPYRLLVKSPPFNGGAKRLALALIPRNAVSVGEETQFSWRLNTVNDDMNDEDLYTFESLSLGDDEMPDAAQWRPTMLKWAALVDAAGATTEAKLAAATAVMMDLHRDYFAAFVHRTTDQHGVTSWSMAIPGHAAIISNDQLNTVHSMVAAVMMRGEWTGIMTTVPYPTDTVRGFRARDQLFNMMFTPNDELIPTGQPLWVAPAPAPAPAPVPAPVPAPAINIDDYSDDDDDDALHAQIMAIGRVAMFFYRGDTVIDLQSLNSRTRTVLRTMDWNINSPTYKIRTSVVADNGARMQFAVMARDLARYFLNIGAIARSYLLVKLRLSHLKDNDFPLRINSMIIKTDDAANPYVIARDITLNLPPGMRAANGRIAIQTADGERPIGDFDALGQDVHVRWTLQRNPQPYAKLQLRLEISQLLFDSPYFVMP